MRTNKFNIYRKVDWLVATVEELTTELSTLKTDLEAIAAAAKAEFVKLEEEIKAAGITPASLDPVKEQIVALDNAVKAVKVPTT